MQRETAAAGGSVFFSRGMGKVRPTSCAAKFCAGTRARSQHGGMLKQVPFFNAVTRTFLFPWERRQFSEDNKGLRTWEKLYWGVFVTAIAGLLFSRVVTPTPAAEPVRLKNTLPNPCRSQLSILSSLPCCCAL